MATVNQPDWRPTNKLAVAALVGPAAVTLWSSFVVPRVPELGAAEITALVGALAAFGAGYIVKDRANVAEAD